MTRAEIEAALQVVFTQCEAAQCPLTDAQKQILWQLVEALGQEEGSSSGVNPLDQLNPEQRQAFLRFVREQEKQGKPWKIKLFNDWLQGQDSGSVQFIRQIYGMDWINQIKPAHLAQYNEQADGETLRLKVGDRIEVCNSLWEWVQENDTSNREWFTCTVIQITETNDTSGGAVSRPHIGCVIRFDSGNEFEIQGVYEWNRPNWRWPQTPKG